jgi:multidrug resistance efflux pump
MAVALLQWQTRPQTDDATVRANFIGIAPQVTRHIVELHVRDNQQVQEGELLFLIDPRPYEIALERARAMMALARKEIDGLKNGAATARVAAAAMHAAELDLTYCRVRAPFTDLVVNMDISEGAFARAGCETISLYENRRLLEGDIALRGLMADPQSFASQVC